LLLRTVIPKSGDGKGSSIRAVACPPTLYLLVRTGRTGTGSPKEAASGLDNNAAPSTNLSQPYDSCGSFFPDTAMPRKGEKRTLPPCGIDVSPCKCNAPPHKPGGCKLQLAPSPSRAPPSLGVHFAPPPSAFNRQPPLPPSAAIIISRILVLPKSLGALSSLRSWPLACWLSSAPGCTCTENSPAAVSDSTSVV
jgi:hypothetical protein